MKTSAYQLLLFCICLLLQLPTAVINAQCPSGNEVYTRLLSIETDNSLTPDKKLATAMQLKKICDDCRLPQDSVYARLLHKIGVFSFQCNNSVPTPVAISYTLQAIRINTSGSKSASSKFAAGSYYNLGKYYQAQKQNSRALYCYDSAVFYSKDFADKQPTALQALLNLSDIYFEQGDYQKNMETSTLSINKARAISDSASLLQAYNQRAQALVYQNILRALQDIDTAIYYAQLLGNHYEMATALKSEAFFYEKNNNYVQAELLYNQAIEERKKSDLLSVASQLSRDYNDFANFFLNAKKDYTQARTWYFKNVQHALQTGDTTALAFACTNMGQASFRQHQWQQAEQYYARAATLLNIAASGGFLLNVPDTQLLLVRSKDLLLVWLNNKTEFLLQLYKEKKERKYLQATMQTALLTDFAITQLRHEQSEEQSKLYWRNRTREFFTNALEACYLSGDAKEAFYFLERSRAVLLNDKLNELGAAAHIPAEALAHEQDLQTKITQAQLQLAALSPSSKSYEESQSRYFSYKAGFDHFIRSLEQQYPAYYQYKYADSVPTIAMLQQYVNANHQSFVHYFMNDTVLYALGVSPGNTQFLKLTQKDFDSRQLSQFLNLCSNKEILNSNYPAFAALAQNIYTQLFKPLQLPKGKVAVCTDNFLIPFEALCTDNKGQIFLLRDYSFSYVYSARSLLRPFISNAVASGNFIGFAPVAFAPALQLVSLTPSANALSQSAGYYHTHTLFIKEAATRSNFFSNASGYAVITIFSHAKADTTNREPVLYMQDAAIHLSELQLLKNPCAQMVLLSACQTNIGKTATGEGIYSLARGFAAAGIPAVAATLWKADEQTVYAISAKFNEYLAAGVNKSDALQQAKLWFISNSDNDEHLLPYYWANMVLIGNTQPLILAKENNSWWWIAAVAAILIVVVVLLIKKNTGIIRCIINSRRAPPVVGLAPVN